MVQRTIAALAPAPTRLGLPLVAVLAALSLVVACDSPDKDKNEGKDAGAVPPSAASGAPAAAPNAGSGTPADTTVAPTAPHLGPGPGPSPVRFDGGGMMPVVPTALPSGLAIPTALPSGFPTALPTAWPKGLPTTIPSTLPAPH